MPRDLFGNVTRPSISIGNRKWYTVPLSLFTHSLAIGVIMALPLLAPAVLPSVFANDDLVVITKVLPPPPPAPPPIKRVDPPRPESDPNVAPLVAPVGIEPERPQPETGWETAVTSTSVIQGDSNAVIAPPPPPPPPKPQEAVRPGGQIRPPQRTREVRPVYPPLAREARVEGIVIIEATIGVDGRVMNARILRSVPLLDQAALDAVLQWEYMPTTLNGVPVPVVMSVTVTFVLK